MSAKKLSIAILTGGDSDERGISLLSGDGVYNALRETNHTIQIIDPSIKSDLAKLISEDIDIAFIALHGKGGEDGKIQGFLESIGLPYTGSGVLASAVAMNKITTKIIYKEAGLITPDYVVYKETEENFIKETKERLSFPCVLKAATEGSAIGVYIVHAEDELIPALNRAKMLSNYIFAEKYIIGKEYTVAVLGEDSCEALPVIAINASNEFYDYEAKYTKGRSTHICPAEISEGLTRLLKDIALNAHKALGCYGVSRSDFIVDEHENVYIIETNTIPGMTETSLLPEAAQAHGLSFTQLCEKMIEFALRKNAKEEN